MRQQRNHPGIRSASAVALSALLALSGCVSTSSGSDTPAASSDATAPEPEAKPDAKAADSDTSAAARKPSDDQHRIVVIEDLSLEVPKSWEDVQPQADEDPPPAAEPGTLQRFRIPAPAEAGGDEEPVTVALIQRPKGHDGPDDEVLAAFRARFTQTAHERSWDQERAWKTDAGAVRWLDLRGVWRTSPVKADAADGDSAEADTVPRTPGWRAVCVAITTERGGDLRLLASGPELAVARALSDLEASVNSLRREPAAAKKDDKGAKGDKKASDVPKPDAAGEGTAPRARSGRGR